MMALPSEGCWDVQLGKAGDVTILHTKLAGHGSYTGEGAVCTPVCALLRAL